MRLRVSTFLWWMVLIGAALCAAVTWQQLWIEFAITAVMGCCGVLIAVQEQPLRFYLRYVNPTAAIVVFGLCYLSSSLDLDQPEYIGMFQGSLQTYFFAKGIFCAIALFLLGKLVERIWYSE